jgi:uncharacterized protein (TIGR02118 family)
MAKLVVLYGHPEDRNAFEDYYANEHLPLAQKMPNVRQAELSRVLGTPDDDQAPYYRVAEMTYDSVEDAQGALDSENGRAVLADLSNFAPDGTVLLISETDQAQ